MFGPHETIMSVLYMTLFRRLIDYLKIPILQPKETQFFVDIITNTINSRRETGDRRGDLIDLHDDRRNEREA